MNYYEIWVASQSYKVNRPLTYGSTESLKRGCLVEIEIKNRPALGFVASQVGQKPKFAVKEIKRIIPVELPKQHIELHHWLLKYYPGSSGSTTRLFLPKSLPNKISFKSEDIKTTGPATNLPRLTKEQQNAIQIIASTESGTALLHGDTGTGKTRVYIELAKAQIASGKSCLVLTPEIGLTPQLTQSLEQVFGNKVIVTHSKLTDADRRNLWLSIATSSEPLIIVGPRSALFMPIKNLGLIVVDEAHDSGYKQDQSPNYLATRVAAKLAQITHSICLLGTATPNISDYYLLRKNRRPIIRMAEPIAQSIKKANVTVVFRKDKSKFKKSWLLSDKLLEDIELVHSKGLTSLIFLNRRGTARVVSCQNCGWQASCPNCELLLTYHHDEHLMRCHSCSFSTRPPLSCPDCSSTDISWQSAGTKAIEKELQTIYPQLSIKRFDSDIKTGEDLASEYDEINRGGYDIIVGTQVIAKGLDLANLGLVGIPFADTSLYLPDYTAVENTYQLLSQVMGRVGRTNKQTKIVIQTFEPHQESLRSAIDKNYDNFYNEQLKERREHHYPPYVYLLQLSYSSKREKSINAAFRNLAQSIKASKELEMLGPTPRFHRKIAGTYNWQVILKAKNRNLLLEVIESLPAGWKHNIDPINLL